MRLGWAASHHPEWYRDKLEELMRYLTLLYLAAIVAFPSVLFAQPPALGEPEVLAAELSDRVAELEALAIRYGEAAGEERLVIDAQSTARAEVAIELLIELGNAIERAEREGRDVAGPRETAVQALAMGTRFTHGDVEMRIRQNLSGPVAIDADDRQAVALFAEVNADRLILFAGSDLNREIRSVFGGAR